ncbi:hypothetical protein [Sphingopyxis fribergensis]
MKSSFPFFALALPLLAGCAAVAATPAANAPKAAASEKSYTEILPKNAVWSYYAVEGEPSGDWKSGAGKAGWKKGGLPLGYGELGLVTEVTKAAQPAMKFPVLYLRKSFSIPAATKGREFTFGMRCDDGCIAFLNGKEIGRLRIKADATGPYRSSGHQDAPLNISVPMADLRKGENILAIEVYQSHAGSSDAIIEAGAILE